MKSKNLGGVVIMVGLALGVTLSAAVQRAWAEYEVREVIPFDEAAVNHCCDALSSSAPSLIPIAAARLA